MATIREHASPIEVWLSQSNIEITCTVVHEDESTEVLPVESLSLRGAQREITGYLIREGYEPAGRWEIEIATEDEGAESVRLFRAKG